jgi:hypothetical protein
MNIGPERALGAVFPSHTTNLFTLGTVLVVRQIIRVYNALAPFTERNELIIYR